MKPGRAGELAQIIFSNSDVGIAPGMGFRKGPHKARGSYESKRGNHGTSKENEVFENYLIRRH